MTFLLFFVVVVCIWCTVFEKNVDTLDIVIVSSFLTLFELTYLPQVTSFFWGTLNGTLICALTLGIPLSFALCKHRSGFFEVLGNLWQRLGGVKGRYLEVVKSSLFLKLLQFFFVIVVIYLLAFVSLVNRFGWDGEAYHSSAAAWFHQNNEIVHLPDHIMPEVNTYPKNLELLSMMSFKLNGSDRFLEIYQLLLFMIATFVLYKVMLYFLAERRLAIIGASVALFHSYVIKQMITTYVDAALFFLFALSLYFLIRGISDSFSWASVVLLALTLGYIAQTKGSGLHVLAVMAPVAGAIILFQRGVSRRLHKLLLLSLLIFLAGGLWWLKNYFVYSNPFYPFAVTLGPLSFEGRSSLGLNIYNIDLSRYAGYKIIFLYFEFFVDMSLLLLLFGYPAIPFFAAKIVKEREFMKLLLFFVPLSIFWVIPSSWIPRYGLILTIPSAIAFAWFIGWIDQKFSGRKIQKVVYSLVTVSLLIQIGDALPSIHREEWSDIALKSFPSKEKSEDPFRDRFDFFRKKAVRVGIEQIRPYEDDPHWYRYWGPQWKNKIIIIERVEDLERVDFYVFPEGSSIFKKEDLDRDMEYVLTDLLEEPGQEELKIHVYKRRESI